MVQWFQEFSLLHYICTFNSEKNGLDILSLEYLCGLCFQLYSCLFVRLIISDFLPSLLVFVRLPSHISSPAFSHRRLPSLERPLCSAADALRDPRFLGFLPPIGTQVALSLSCFLIGRTQSYLRSDWSNPAPTGGASESEDLREAGKLLLGGAWLLIFAYIHTGNRPKC